MPCLTAGIGAKAENLLVPEEELLQKGIGIFHLKRGGDFTAHEPGQIVGYLHIDLERRAIGLGDFLDVLNESLLGSIAKVWGVDLVTNPKAPGLYLKNNPIQKLVSLGISAKSYFTSFGFALNAVNDLSSFLWIHPCGGKSENMTTLDKLGKIQNFSLEKELFVREFHESFLEKLQK